MSNTLHSADHSTVRLLDAAVLAWLVLWIAVGIYTGIVTWRLSDVGDTVSRSGSAVSSTGQALESFGSVPGIGDRAGELGTEIQASGDDVQTRGQTVKGQLHQLSILLGLTIAAVPTTPVVGLYLPLRQARRRQVRRVRRALSAPEPDPALDRYLAQQALTHLSFADVRDVVTAGDERGLADAELTRLGLTRPSRARG